MKPEIPCKKLFKSPPFRKLINVHLFLDELVKTQKAPVIVIPVKTGIQENQSRRGGRDGLGAFLRDHIS